MKRSRFLPLICLVCFWMGSSSLRSDVIYDSFDGLNQASNSFTTTGQTPRNHMADDLSTITTASMAQLWGVESISVRIFALGSGVAGQNRSYDGVTMRIRVWEAFDAAAAAGTSVFTQLVSDVVWNLGTVTNVDPNGLNQAIVVNQNYLGTGNQFNLRTGQNIGVAIEFLSNGTADQGLSPTLRSLAGDPGLPSIGTSSNGFYRDGNANGIIEATDRSSFTGTNSNMHLIINATATAIPEPTAAGLICLGLVSMGLKRRRQSA